MDYHVADIKDLINQRMEIVSKKLVTGNQKLEANKDAAS